jgi:hypothetical protein
MSARAQVYFIGLLAIFISIGAVLYKSQLLGLPLTPGNYQTVWTIEAKVEFQADGLPVKASLALPKTQSNMEVLEEFFSSSGYGFNVENEEGHQRAVWSKREAMGKQSLYYKLNVYQGDKSIETIKPEFSITPRTPHWNGVNSPAVIAAAESLIEKSWKISSDTETFAGQLLIALNDNKNSDALLIRETLANVKTVQIALDLLASAEVPAQIIRGIYLDADRSRIAATELIEIYNGSSWQQFNPETGRKGLPKSFLVWQRGDKSLLDLEGGRRSKVTFSVLSNNIPAREVAIKEAGEKVAMLVDYSIYSLPIEQQSVFKSILMVPVGALLVLFMRVFVGLRTAGTFMPVLLALAFIQTNLVSGVVIFLVILAVGLWVRSYLSGLDLLLVSRLAAAVVIVVILMAIISIVSYKMGLEQALKVTFFPMIIIAWTIEHMSILWEDGGPREVLIQTGGSLFVAILCYALFTNNYMEHWVFNFPELLLAILGVIIMLGHYTGYRLSEILRFRHLRVK